MEFIYQFLIGNKLIRIIIANIEFPVEPDFRKVTNRFPRNNYLYVGSLPIRYI